MKSIFPRQVDVLPGEVWDLVIIGGGISGAGTALDAALRGYRVALIDKGDFASGTSSASSKLVHGGLRYLEHAEFHLVYEALHERGRLLVNAPHLVHPLPFMLPFYRGDRVPGWKWRIGLTLYDLLAGSKNIRRSRPLTDRQIQAAAPGLNAAHRRGGAQYFDAQMDDARLCLEVLLTAAQQGAVCVNYVEALDFQQREGTIRSVRALDHLSGAEFEIHGRLFLNAGGPWVDAVCRKAGDGSGPHLKPTKGVHVILPSLGIDAGLLLLHPADARVFFVLPWQGKTLLGTTDTFVAEHESPDALTPMPRDVDYLLEAFHHFFPHHGTPTVMGSFAGLRPLLHSNPDHPSAMTREFRVFRSAGGLLSVAGGKYTTFRSMAEKIVDSVADILGKRRRCATRHLPLIGTPAEPWADFLPAALSRLQCDHGLAEASARHLLLRYGTRAFTVAMFLDDVPAGRQPVHADEPDLTGEIAYQKVHEMAHFPADHFLRRSRIGMYRPDLLPSKP